MLQTGDLENITSVQLGQLEGLTQFALDSHQNFLSDCHHGKMNPWYLYFWEHADKYELLAATVTELTSAVGAVDTNSVPLVVATSTASRSIGSKRKYQTPKNRKHRGYTASSDNEDDDNDTMSSGNTAMIGSALLKLGNETKMSPIEQHIGTLRQDVCSIIARIDGMKRLIHQHKIDAIETKSAEKNEMYLGFVAEYNANLCDLKSQWEEVNNSVKNLEEKLD
jgi:hypothetical protein